MHGLRLDEDGRLGTVTWTDETDSLDALQSAVQGWVDVVQVTPTVTMWVDDEGAYRRGVNRPATRLLRLHGELVSPIFGPVVFTGCRGWENETVSLSPAAEAWLRGWAAGRCTCIEQRADRAVWCGSASGHPGVSHAAVVDHEQWLWNGAPAPSLAALPGGAA